MPEANSPQPPLSRAGLPELERPRGVGAGVPEGALELPDALQERAHAPCQWTV